MRFQYLIPVGLEFCHFGGIIAYWPVIANRGLYRTQTGGSPTNQAYVPYWWIDTTKAPINRPA